MIGVAGLRYGELNQNFLANYTDAIAGGVPDYQVMTDIDFSGMAMRLGLEAEAFHPCRRLMFYAKGYSNFLFGEFDATYRQTSAGRRGPR